MGEGIKGTRYERELKVPGTNGLPYGGRGDGGRVRATVRSW